MDQPVDPLAALRDIRLPPAPPDPGLGPTPWLVLAALLLAGLLVWRFLPTRRAWVRDALGALDRLKGLPGEDALVGAAAVVRRAALHLGADAAAMRLSGATWAGALDRLFGTRFFTRGPGRRLGEALYARGADAGADELIRGLKRVIRRRGRRP